MEERWRAIPGFEGYEASDRGRVRSFWRRATKDEQEPTGATGAQWVVDKHPQRILSDKARSSGYPIVSLMRNGKREVRRIHHLVTRTFIGPCPDGLEVCHNDGDKENNCIENLRYDTHQANLAEMCLHDTSRVSRNTVENIRRKRAAGHSIASLAEDYGLTHSVAGAICRHRTYKAVGGGRAPKQWYIKLTPKEICAIKERYAAGGITLMQLAKEYDVSESMISLIKNGHRHQDITGG